MKTWNESTDAELLERVRASLEVKDNPYLSEVYLMVRFLLHINEKLDKLIELKQWKG